MRLRVLTSLSLLALCSTAGSLAAQAKIVGYENVPWGTSRAEIVRLRGQPDSERTQGLGPGMAMLMYGDENGAIGFTVSERSGLIQVARSVELDPTSECEVAFDGLYAMFRERFPAFTPVGKRVNNGTTDLCASVRDGKGEAKYTWTDPANDATLSIEVIPGTAAFSMFLATPEYRQWFATRNQPAAPAAAGGLTLADAERIGFRRTDPKNFRYIGAADGSGGTINRVMVELYSYAGAVPAAKIAEFRGYAGADKPFGWVGVCTVRNLIMLYAEESACTALKSLDRR